MPKKNSENVEQTTQQFVMIPIEKLHPHPDNPRKELGDLTELADSIRAKGVFQNLTVVQFEDDYRIIIGHRRRAASELAGLTHLPCVIVDMTPKEQVETMLLENMQREDLTPYEQAQGFQMMIDMGDTVEEIVQKTGTKKLFYCLDEDTGKLSFYVEREKPAPVRRPQEEIDREKAQADANEKCAELTALCHKLRSEFVKKLSYGSKNQKEMLYGMVRAILIHCFHYTNVSSSELFAVLGEERPWKSDDEKVLTDRLLEKPASTYPGIVYAAFCDNDKEGYHTTYKKQWPKHAGNERLDALYAWLTSVGYVMSDDEKAMQDGTQELLHLGEQKPNNEEAMG